MQITWQGQTYDVGKPERLEVAQAMDSFPWISRFLFKQEGLPGFLRVTILWRPNTGSIGRGYRPAKLRRVV